MFPSFSIVMSTPTLNTSHKPQQLAPTVGLTRSSYVRSMTFQSTNKFLPVSRLVFRSLLFIIDKMGNLSLQEPEPWEITESGTDRVHQILTQDGLTCEAQLRHGSCLSGESDLDPSGDRADHHEMCCHAATNLICKPSPESDSDNS
jgi:hypothetical protein